MIEDKCENLVLRDTYRPYPSSSEGIKKRLISRIVLCSVISSPHDRFTLCPYPDRRCKYKQEEDRLDRGW